MINLGMVDFKSLELDGIDSRDYPDFCDAYISGGYYLDGTPLADDVLEVLSNDGELVHKLVFDFIF